MHALQAPHTQVPLALEGAFYAHKPGFYLAVSQPASR